MQPDRSAELLALLVSVKPGAEGPDMARVHAELQAGFEALDHVHGAVSVFGSARTHPDDPDYQFAYQVGRALGQAGHPVITGGGPGLMEAANRGARDGGGLSVGLAIKLPQEEQANPHVDIQLDFTYFFTRKVFYVRPSSAFVVLPGGAGTLDELFEALTLVQTAKIDRLPIILARSAYWEGLIDWMRAKVAAEGKMDPAELDLLQVADTPEEIVQLVGGLDSQPLGKYLYRRLWKRQSASGEE